VPAIKSAGDLDLDVSDTKLQLRSLPESSSDYFLSFPLTYKCNGEAGKAKWDKHKKVLAVTIPVRPPTAKEIEEMKTGGEDGIEVVASTEAEEEAGEEGGGNAQAVEDAMAEMKLAEKAEAGVAKKAKNKKKKEETKEKEKEKTKERKSTREAFATDAPIPVNNSAAEYKKKTVVQEKAERAEKAPPPPPKQTVKVSGPFTASKYVVPCSGPQRQPR
jgi:hypothetical protein